MISEVAREGEPIGIEITEGDVVVSDSVRVRPGAGEK